MPSRFNVKPNNGNVTPAPDKPGVVKCPKPSSNALTDTAGSPLNYTNPIAAKIQQRRYQMLVHAYLYYALDDPRISDHKWDTWAQELAQLQRDNPDLADKVKYAKEFADFDPSTGFNLDYRKPEIMCIAERLRNGALSERRLSESIRAKAGKPKAGARDSKDDKRQGASGIRRHSLWGR